MEKMRPTTLAGLRRLLRADDWDVFDLLQAAPAVLRDAEDRRQAEEREQRRLEWLAAYEPNLALCAREGD